MLWHSVAYVHSIIQRHITLHTDRTHTVPNFGQWWQKRFQDHTVVGAYKSAKWSWIHNSTKLHTECDNGYSKTCKLTKHNSKCTAATDKQHATVTTQPVHITATTGLISPTVLSQKPNSPKKSVLQRNHSPLRRQPSLVIIIISNNKIIIATIIVFMVQPRWPVAVAKHHTVHLTQLQVAAKPLTNSTDLGRESTPADCSQYSHLPSLFIIIITNSAQKLILMIPSNRAEHITVRVCKGNWKTQLLKGKSPTALTTKHQSIQNICDVPVNLWCDN